MAFTTDLCAGLAQYLVGVGIGVYNPTGTYQPTDVAFIIGTVPQDPDSVICLTPYALPESSPNPFQADEQLGVQFWLRGANGDPRPVLDLENNIYGALHGLADVAFGSAFMLLAWRHNDASMGQDSRGRSQRVANYYLRVHHPTAHTE